MSQTTNGPPVAVDPPKPRDVCPRCNEGTVSLVKTCEGKFHPEYAGYQYVKCSLNFDKRSSPPQAGRATGTKCSTGYWWLSGRPVSAPKVVVMSPQKKSKEPCPKCKSNPVNSACSRILCRNCCIRVQAEPNQGPCSVSHHRYNGDHYMHLQNGSPSGADAHTPAVGTDEPSNPPVTPTPASRGRSFNRNISNLFPNEWTLSSPGSPASSPSPVPSVSRLQLAQDGRNSVNIVYHENSLKDPESFTVTCNTLSTFHPKAVGLLKALCPAGGSWEFFCVPDNDGVWSARDAPLTKVFAGSSVTLAPVLLRGQRIRQLLLPAPVHSASSSVPLKHQRSPSPQTPRQRIKVEPGLTNTLASLESTSDAVIDLTLPEAEAANADKASSADARGGRRDNEDSDDEVIIIAGPLTSTSSDKNEPFPRQYTAQMVEGFGKIESLKGVTRREAFEAAFPCKYKKSTFYDHFSIYQKCKKAHANALAVAVKAGASEEGLWAAMVTLSEQ